MIGVIGGAGVSEIIYPDSETQKMVTMGICNIKNKYRFSDITSPHRPCQIFKQVTEYLLAAGAEIVIVRCTDIRVDFLHSTTIDSLEILCDSIIKETNK